MSTHHAVSVKDLLKAKAALTHALTIVDSLLPLAQNEVRKEPVKRKPRTRDEKIVNPEGGFQP